jgi:hypothetical protein
MGLPSRDGCRQRRLAVVNVTDGPHVHMGLVSFELLFRHRSLFLSSSSFLASRFAQPLHHFPLGPNSPRVLLYYSAATACSALATSGRKGNSQ